MTLFENQECIMRLLSTVTTIAFALSATQTLAAELITKPSAYSVDETINRLVSAVEGAGAKVFARVDHAKGAAAVGSDLRPTQMLMFGNPKLGTPALIAGQISGLDLPLRVLAYEDADGKVFVTYHPPAELSENYGIPADAAVLKKMTGALNKLTDKATTGD
jgi:uncharacterized protein (DUF302 family)